MDANAFVPCNTLPVMVLVIEPLEGLYRKTAEPGAKLSDKLITGTLRQRSQDQGWLSPTWQHQQH